MPWPQIRHFLQGSRMDRHHNNHYPLSGSSGSSWSPFHRNAADRRSYPLPLYKLHPLPPVAYRKPWPGEKRRYAFDKSAKSEQRTPRNSAATLSSRPCIAMTQRPNRPPQMRVVSTDIQFKDLEDAWDHLIEHSTYQAPFHTWGWHQTWWRCFGGARSLYLITGKDAAGELQIVAPLMRQVRRVSGFPLVELRFMANDNSPFNSIIHRSDITTSDATSSVLACLSRHFQEWHMITLRNIPHRLLDQDAMTAVAIRHGMKPLFKQGWRSAYLTIEGSFDEYVSRQLGKQRLRGIAQKVRQLCTHADYRLHDYQTPEEMPHAVDQAFAISAASWKARQGTNMSGKEDMRRFYEEISLRLAKSGNIRIFTSSLAHSPLALQYNLVSPDTMYLLINDFNETHRRQSPGTVLLYQVLGILHQEHSVTRFQFSGDLYDYKSNWASGVEQHFTTTIFHPGVLSRALWFWKGLLLPRMLQLRSLIERGRVDDQQLQPLNPQRGFPVPPDTLP